MNARDNPFRSERMDALAYRAPGFSWEDFERRVAALGGRAAIVAPPGHGKSTLLDGFARRLAARGDRIRRLQIEFRQRRLRREQRTAFSGWWLVDGVEQLAWPGWLELRWLARGSRGLVVTSHRPGRLPTAHACRTSPALLDELRRELTGAGLPDAEARWRRHRGDVRAALRECYDQAAGAVGGPFSMRVSS